MLSQEHVEQLIICSMCMDRFTNPKLLPCGHTFCLACLVGINRNNLQKIPCPLCREEHTIPPGGIDQFKTNFVLNELLIGLSSTVEQSPAECGKCQRTDTVTPCDHCDSKLCVQCMPRHTALIAEIKTLLSIIKPQFTQPAKLNEILQKKNYWNAVLSDLISGKETIEKSFEQHIKELEQRKEVLLNYMDAVRNTILLVKDVENVRSGKEVHTRLNADIYLQETDEKLKKFLDTCRSYMTSMDTLKALQKGERFRFQPDKEIELSQELLSYGKIFLGGKQLVGTRDDDIRDNIEEVEAGASQAVSAPSTLNVKQQRPVKAHLTPEEHRETEPTQMNQNRQQWKSVPASSAPNIHQQRTEQAQLIQTTQQREIVPAPLTTSIQQQPIIDYKAKIRGWKEIVNLPDWSILSGVAYDSKKNTIRMTDTAFRGFENVRVTRSGKFMERNGCDSVGLDNLIDICCSPDGVDMAFSGTGEITIVRYSMCSHRRTIQEVGSEKLEGDCYLACSDNNIFVADRNCITVLHWDGRFIRRFGQQYLRDPRHITIGPYHGLYVTDNYNGNSCVHVFNMDGSYDCCFVEECGIDSTGIAVDSEGYVSVSRTDSHFIDVYSPDGSLHCSYGRRQGKKSEKVSGQPGRHPGQFNNPKGLYILPDGGLVVVDSGNHRIQIL